MRCANQIRPSALPVAARQNPQVWWARLQNPVCSNRCLAVARCRRSYISGMWPGIWVAELGVAASGSQQNILDGRTTTIANAAPKRRFPGLMGDKPLNGKSYDGLTRTFPRKTRTPRLIRWTRSETTRRRFR